MYFNIGVSGDITFHSDATATGNGTVYNVAGGATKLIIEVSGTATSGTVVFEGKIKDTWYAISCKNRATLANASQTTSKAELWEMDLTGLIGVRCRISAVGGGNLSVIGRSVN